MFVSAYGPDRLGSVAAMTACIAAARGNISASKIITIGEDIAFMLVVSAPSEVGDSLGNPNPNPNPNPSPNPTPTPNPNQASAR